MNNVLVKTYASICPASDGLYSAMRTLLEDWHVEEALSRRGDTMLISYEGIYFPAEQAAQIIGAHLDNKSEGKLDYLDLENWQLHRYLILGRHLAYRNASLDLSLEYCAQGRILG